MTNDSWVGTYKKGPLRPGEEPKADYYYTQAEVDAMLAGEGRDGAPGLIGIPNSNEQSKKDHLNTFWTPWNNTEMEDVTLEKKIEHVESMVNAEGLQPRQHINHPGRYYGGSDKATGEEAANDPANIQRYVDIFEKNTKALRGMEIVNKVGDGDSYSDRIIWDNILAETMPEQNVWGYANDDAHSTGALGYDYNNLLMPELTEEAVQAAMDSGAWYSTAFVAKRELGADFKGDRWQPGPVISDIVVDEKEDTITIEGDNYNVIEWIADGEIIATGNTLDLDEYGKDIDNYVRAQLKGDNGISFTNAFGIDFAKKTNNGRFLSDSEAADFALASIDRTTADVHVARDFKGKDKQFVVTITTADGVQTVNVDAETGEIL